MRLREPQPDKASRLKIKGKRKNVSGLQGPQPDNVSQDSTNYQLSTINYQKYGTR